MFTFVSPLPKPGRVFRCVKCRKECAYSAESDYICEDHGFVNAIREDGGVVRGDGRGREVLA